jgi:cytochrome oxidase Cu insertion factor (SCO1/SenC/PrrC family)
MPIALSVGSFGSAQEIASVTDACHVYDKKVPVGDKPDPYMMDHSTILFLLDRATTSSISGEVWMRRK